jgi:hypothetical protein
MKMGDNKWDCRQNKWEKFLFVSGMRRYFNDFNVTVATEGNI